MTDEHTLGKSFTLNDGNSIPLVGLGTSRILPNETISVITTAIDIGYRHFDTSEFYKNTTQLGDGLRQVLLSGKVNRDELFITAKLEYVDLCLLHFPIQFKKGATKCNNDPKFGEYINGFCDHVQLWKEMEDVVEKGLAMSIGVSNFNQQQIKNIIQTCKIPPAVLQTECHAYLQVKDLVKFCQHEGIFITAFAPFGSPGLSKFEPCYKECDILSDEVVLDLVRKYGRTSAQILLRYLIQRGIGVIPKSSDAVRLTENINIFDFSLTDDDMEMMTKLDKNGRIFSFPFFKEHPQYPYCEEIN
ncbi:aldo-keto reductase 1B-like isoform X2 [Mytilus galloprovincialis]|uniref:aldo-keto reductase 1B-like isoform X2 n=1 Tax=Mytilus galloprovincialis TaxID=29158 RepID=UPI003F7BC37D